MSNELHTMPLKIERLLSSRKVRMLELDEFGAYIKLLCDAWLDGGYLDFSKFEDEKSAHAKACAKEKCSLSWALSRALFCPYDQAVKIKENVLEVFFRKDEYGRWYNKTNVEIYGEVLHETSKNKLRGQLGAAARWGHELPQEDEKSAHAKAMPRAEKCPCLSNGNQSQSQSQSNTIGSVYFGKDIYGHFVNLVDPLKLTEKKAIKNINILAKKGYKGQDLMEAVENYSSVMPVDHNFRKFPANFFCPDDCFFEDYLPGKFKTKATMMKKKQQEDFRQALQEDRFNDQRLKELKENAATPEQVNSILDEWMKKHKPRKGGGKGNGTKEK